MPGVTLVIEPGATLEFFPSVGILVLGRLEAIGRRDDRITMRPIDTSTATHYRIGRQTRSALEAVRLCVEGQCEGRRDGFLDIFNGTTKQWVPVCDDRFTERNAEVVCHQLGYNKVNIFYSRNNGRKCFPVLLSASGHGLTRSVFRVEAGRVPASDEWQIYDHSYECAWNGDFILGAEFRTHGRVPRLHQQTRQHPHSSYIHGHPKSINPSVMEWVDIIGAGILHNDKSQLSCPSRYASLRGVTVRNSASDGVSIVSATKDLKCFIISESFVTTWAWASRSWPDGRPARPKSRPSSPWPKVRLPYHMLGCGHVDSTKELMIEERILLYYKYDNRPVDCVKIFSSGFNVKNFGFRLLQYNSYNSTMDPMMPDRIVLYDGDIYNYTTDVFAEIHMNSNNLMKFFKTEGTSISVELHATGASGTSASWLKW
ncbi:hypothetical protein C7M84_021437 [Penaeus vannamei]|uniref:SRCR domain-containing protein n=1 Tax=Penaeus vannamei TaxID=6689 RepID=A0A3R7P4C5_PENVA|nr:hypothetical protein C7M84_021437 [Penaeus vannamei]